jgi:hypothetical protein
VLAVMEALTLLSAAAMVAAMASVHAYASDDRKVFGTLALAFTVAFAGVTSTVHFVELTAMRQLGGGGIVWPSTAYAAELLAWDWFLGLNLMAAAPVFSDVARERGVRRGFWLSGAFAWVGTVGPVTGEMRLQRIGIVGYAVVLPVVFFLLARLFLVRSRAALRSVPEKNGLVPRVDFRGGSTMISTPGDAAHSPESGLAPPGAGKEEI